MASILIIRGGGDLATGVAHRLIHSGIRVVITELPQPLAVRRTVSFAEAIYTGQFDVEGITARCVDDPSDTLKILSILGKGQVPVIVDPQCTSAKTLRPSVIVDGRMTKQPPSPIDYIPQLYIGLGPGFIGGKNCQVVVETRRGHTLGRVYWNGGPEPDTGNPEGDHDRVLRAPMDGIFSSHKQIGDHCEEGEIIAEIEPTSVTSPPTNQKSQNMLVKSPLDGILRGLLHPGLKVFSGMKIGDIDPRNDPSACRLISDKALSIGGAVLEAVLSRPEIRSTLWT